MLAWWRVYSNIPTSLQEDFVAQILNLHQPKLKINEELGTG